MTQKHRSISLIVIHCSATRVTQDFTFEQLEACHLARGFTSIGYHYYITREVSTRTASLPIRVLQPRIRLCIRFWRASAYPILMQRYWATAICRTFTKTVRRLMSSDG